MKRQLLGILIFLLCAGLANAQLYPNRFEQGDTLVGSTPDTTNRCLIYNGNPDNPRPVRPTVYCLITEIGTNSTHYWLQIDVDIADRDLVKDGNGWAHAGSYFWQDWLGYGASSQNDFAIPLPYLDAYAGKYFRLRLHYPVGASTDSTAYELTYMADESGNMASQSQTNFKIISHKDMWGQIGARLIIGATTANTNGLDFRIETSPGIYRLPNRGYLTLYGDGVKCDDDTMFVYPRRQQFNTINTVNLDTLTIPITTTSAADAEFSFTLHNGTGFVDVVRLYFVVESEDLEDSCYIYSSIYLECDP